MKGSEFNTRWTTGENKAFSEDSNDAPARRSACLGCGEASACFSNDDDDDDNEQFLQCLSLRLLDSIHSSFPLDLKIVQLARRRHAQSCETRTIDYPAAHSPTPQWHFTRKTLQGHCTLAE